MTTRPVSRSTAHAPAATPVAAPHPPPPPSTTSAGGSGNDAFDPRPSGERTLLPPGWPADTQRLQRPNFTRETCNTSGAYFRKVSSPARRDYVGIRAHGRLPEVSFDPARRHLAADGVNSYKSGPLDRPSVYLGGTSGGREMDVGLTWDRVYDPGGRPTFTDRANGCDGRDPAHRFVQDSDQGQPVLRDGSGQVVVRGRDEVAVRLQQLQPNFAFRPYWRTSENGSNEWHNAKPGTPENRYYYPGDEITMTVQQSGAKRGRLDIRVENGTEPHYTQPFVHDGLGIGRPQSFKRVNSIDQFYVEGGERHGNENRTIIPTATEVRNGAWFDVQMLHANGSTSPMVGTRFTEVRGRDTSRSYGQIFGLGDFNTAGGERIDITPPHP